MCSAAAGREGRTQSRTSLHQFLALPQPYPAVLISRPLTVPSGPGSEIASFLPTTGYVSRTYNL